MTKAITDIIEQELDPRVVSNALHELMLEWYREEMTFRTAPTRDSGQGRAARRRAASITRVISRFLGVDERQVRELLLNHYNLGIRNDS